jgi:hypothetical protein
MWVFYCHFVNYTGTYETRTLSFSPPSLFLAQLDNYIIFGVFAVLGVIGVFLMLFIIPVNKKKVIA